MIIVRGESIQDDVLKEYIVPRLGVYQDLSHQGLVVRILLHPNNCVERIRRNMRKAFGLQIPARTSDFEYDD